MGENPSGSQVFKVFYKDWKHSSPRFQRTEQRGIQMLLKSVPEAEQQALVTGRVLSSTAIIYRLLVRFQPGGAGEKQLLLSQLTTVPKGKDVHEVAAGLRNRRRHYGRAQEVNATLPDGVLLLKALDVPLQQLGQLDPLGPATEPREPMGIFTMLVGRGGDPGLLQLHQRCHSGSSSWMARSNHLPRTFLVVARRSSMPWQTSPAGSSCQIRVAKLASHASGNTLGKVSATKHHAVGNAAAKSIERTSAQ